MPAYRPPIATVAVLQTRRGPRFKHVAAARERKSRHVAALAGVRWFCICAGFTIFGLFFETTT